MSRRCPVIGLVGGIGAGKSFVASCFAELGCIVSDSDAGVRELLARPEVVAELTSWWGGRILREDGTLDRKVISGIVFADPEQRKRLEGLLHPMLKVRREETVRDAARSGCPAVILDAPLLLEAGLAAECDAIVFVDASREVRLARVAARGWDEAELDRRENAQKSLLDKRAASGYIVVNAGDAAQTRQQVARTLQHVLGSIAD